MNLADNCAPSPCEAAHPPAGRGVYRIIIARPPHRSYQSLCNLESRLSLCSIRGMCRRCSAQSGPCTRTSSKTPRTSSCSRNIISSALWGWHARPFCRGFACSRMCTRCASSCSKDFLQHPGHLQDRDSRGNSHLSLRLTGFACGRLGGSNLLQKEAENAMSNERSVAGTRCEAYMQTRRG